MRPHAALPRPTPAGALTELAASLVLLLPLLLLLPGQALGQAKQPLDEVDVYAGTGCMFEGVRYKPGQAVPVKDEPCLHCRCRRGAPVCRLRVCAPLPDPPPPGCVLLHRANTCCPQLHCPETGAVDNRLEARHGGPMRYRSDGPNKGCYLNGSLFAEGSALSSSTLCDYCYCVRGQQRCVRPQCVLPAPGCTPEYRDHTCCPTSYHCSSGNNSSSSIAAVLVDPPRRRGSGCTVDGKRYREGAQVKSVARGRCESCFCMRGRVRCAPLKCDLAVDGCEPVTEPGRCCPVSYDCSKSRVSIKKTVSSASSHSTKGGATKGENTVRSISYDARSNREISSQDTSKVKNEADHSEPYVILTTQLPLSEESPKTLTGHADNIAITLNTKLDLGDNLELLKIKNNSVIPEKNKILPVIEAIINKTREKEQDYDYDYNEPSLPPSLPNLRIIPFVAEDAVIPEEKLRTDDGHNLPESSNAATSKESQDKKDNFYFFSPPAETEGGFVPRDPMVDGPYYQPPYNSQSSVAGQKTSTKTRPSEVTIRTVVPDSVTPDPLLGNAGSAPCMSGGRRYRHGELLTNMRACRMCFCFDGGVMCQEPSCGSVPPGCSRSPAREPDQCCGSIECGDADRDRPLLFADDSEPHEGHFPERPAVVTPVIEPVPDLVPSLSAPVVNEKPTTTSTTTSTTSATTSTSTTTTAPKTTTTTTAPPPRTTTVSNRYKSPSSTTSKPITTTTPRSKPTTKPAIKTKATTAKTTRRPSSTTPRPSPTTTQAAASSKKPSPSNKTTSPPKTSTTSSTTVSPLKATSTATAKTTSTTTAAPRTTTTAKPVTTAAPTTTTTTNIAAPTTTNRPPLRKERPTTTPTSLFDVLWGSEDESANEAQDKVDEDVQYEDFVSTNQHDQEAAAGTVEQPVKSATDPDEDDSFSFDKFLELFMQPDPTTTTTASTRVSVTTPTPSSTSRVPTSSTTTSTPKANATSPTSTTARTPPKHDVKPAPSTTPSTTPRPTTKATTTPPAKKTAAAKPKPPPKAPATTPSKPPASTTKASITKTTAFITKGTSSTTKSTVTTTTSTPTTTTTTAKTTEPSTASRRTASTPTTTPTTSFTETTTTRTTSLPIATVRPSLLFGSNKNRPSFLPDGQAAGGGSSSSYPAQLHHMSTRRPPASTSVTPGLQGVSGLLKLAGCNIYGRMYRVGRIIQELSGPCLECRCTEVGVQCQQLNC